jgi:hypothetical protein
MNAKPTWHAGSRRVKRTCDEKNGKCAEAREIEICVQCLSAPHKIAILRIERQKEGRGRRADACDGCRKDESHGWRAIEGRGKR